MAQPVVELLESIQVGEPVAAGPVQVFGLKTANGHPLAYQTLDEALAAGTLRVGEVSEGGQVSALRVENAADSMTFLMAGEHLVGAKQNRVLNASLMAAGRSTLAVPVSCVEARRWHYRSPHFASGGTLSYSSLRAFTSRSVAEGYRRHGTPVSDQQGIWQRIALKLGLTKTASPTFAMHDAYEHHWQTLNETANRLAAPAGCRGAAFALGGTVVGIDLFDQPATLAKLWLKIVRSYVMEVFGNRPPATTVSASDVQDWVRSAAKGHAEEFKSPGLGEDVRLEGAGVVGSGLVVDGCAVHLELFSMPQT